MTLALVVEAGAANEIEKATRWYEQKDPSLAFALTREVRKAFADLVVRPPTRTLVAPGIAPELGVRRILLPTFPYAIVLLEIEATIYVLAFAHLRKKPDYWHGRLRKFHR